MFVAALLLLSVFALTAFYFYSTRNYGWFRARGIPEVTSYPPLGSLHMWRLLTAQVSYIHMIDEAVKHFPKEPLIGTVSISKPQLVVNDLEIAKLVLIKDFDHFVDRKPFLVYQTSYIDRVTQNMFIFLKGEEWRNMRNSMSPLFSSGKLRKMMPLLHKVGHQFTIRLNKAAESEEEFNGKEMMANFTMDVLTNCGLGVQSNALNDPDCTFKKKARQFGTSGQGAKQMITLLMLLYMPWLAQRVLGLSFFEKEFMDFFMGIIDKSVEHRRSKDGVRRDDFIDVILDIMASDDEQKFKQMSSQEVRECLMSNILLLFFAGFETTSTLMSISLWLLAKHQDVQEKLAEEILAAIHDKGDSELDYNTIQNLPQMEMFLNEMARFYPLTVLERMCVKDYKMPGTNLTVPAGMIVQVASNPILRDKQYFPYPDEFNPENFSPEAKAKRPSFAFLAFGQGPRGCIGVRMAYLHIKVSLVYILSNFVLTMGQNSPEELVIDPLSQAFQPIGGVWVKVKKRTE